MFGRDKERFESTETLPLVPLRDVVVFPQMMAPFVVGRPGSVQALEMALPLRRIFLATQRDAACDNPRPDEIHEVGTICTIVQSLRLPDGNVKVLVEGRQRARTIECRDDQDAYRATVAHLSRPMEDEVDFAPLTARSSSST
jgi:ATP-dependent Lon protease